MIKKLDKVGDVITLLLDEEKERDMCWQASLYRVDVWNKIESSGCYRYEMKVKSWKKTGKD